MTSTLKTTAATALTQSQFVDGEAYEIDASDFTTPFAETEANIDEARATVSVSAGDTHVKTLDAAIVAGTGVTVTKTNTGADEALTVAADGANITALNAANLSSGTVAHERGGLEADVSAYSGLIKIAAGSTSQAVAETDYVTPSGAGTLANKTLTTPTVASFANATHDHSNAAGGGQLTTTAFDSGVAASGTVLTANGSGGVSWAAAGGGGAVPVDISVTAGETLAERDVVFVDMAAGTAKKIDIDATTPLVGFLRGICNQAGGIASAASGTVRVLGEVSGFTGLTAWGAVYASATAGGYTQTKPSPTDGGGQVAVVPVGVAVSTTAVMVLNGLNVKYLKRETLANNATLTLVHQSDLQGRERMVSAYVAGAATNTATEYASSNQDSDVAIKQRGAALTYGTDATGSGTASASDVGTGAAANAVDNNAGTIWGSSGTPSGGSPITWQYDFGGGATKAIERVTVQADATYFTNCLSSWTFEGSNNASDWTVLDTQSGLTWTTAEVKTIDFTNGTEYRYYRFNVTGTQSAGNINVAEIQLIEGATWTVGDSKLAQSFQVTGATTVDAVGLWLKKVGAPTGNLTVKIQTDSAGSPSGTTVTNGTSSTVAASTLSTSYGMIAFDFSTNPTLSGSTTYWLVLETADSDSGTNYVVWGADGSTPGYADGAMKSFDTSSWNAESKDAVFEVLEPATAFDEVAVVGRWSGGTRDIGVRFDDGAGADGNTKTTFKNVSGSSLDVTCVVELA